jgi:metal-sulfur cluster biosynthetic enzyme
MSGPMTEQVREQLRAVSLPGFNQDIVAAGFVEEIDVRTGSARVGVEMRTRRTDETAAIEEGIRQDASSPLGVEREEIRLIEFEIALIPDGGRNPGSAGRGSGRGVAADALR